LLEEKEEVSKSRTCWYAPAWNAVWMLISSGGSQWEVTGALWYLNLPPSGE
jgi:hypothetical protein